MSQDTGSATNTRPGAAFRERLARGEQTYGLWLTHPIPSLAYALAGTGLDYVCIDDQHGIAGREATSLMVHAIWAAGSAPVVRVSHNDPTHIGWVLDTGAVAVIVPMVDSRADALKAVDACHYPPHGSRSFGPMGATHTMGSRDPVALSKVACIVMIETAAALDNVEEIITTPGIDGVYIGPFDLAVSLKGRAADGHPPVDVVDAIETIRAVCARNSVPLGIHCLTGADARKYADAGFQVITTAVDEILFCEAVTSNLDDAKSPDAKEPEWARSAR